MKLAPHIKRPLYQSNHRAVIFQPTASDGEGYQSTMARPPNQNEGYVKIGQRLAR